MKVHLWIFSGFGEVKYIFLGEDDLVRTRIGNDPFEFAEQNALSVNGVKGITDTFLGAVEFMIENELEVTREIEHEIK